MNVIVSIENVDVPLAEVSIRAMNFGQAGFNRQVHPYDLIVSSTCLVETMRAYYGEFAADDVAHGEADEPEEILQLRSLRWPSLESLLADDPVLFERFAKRFLAFDFLTALFGASASIRVWYRYLINSVAGVKVRGQQLIFSGEVIDMEAE